MVREAKQGRLCLVCSGPIPLNRNARAVYCSKRCKDRALAAPKQWRYHLKRDFGLTEADYDAMVARQGGKCAVCKRDEPNGRGRWHVDHDHKSGRIRGLLCHNCNLMLGYAKDDPAILRAAVRYLTP